MVTRGEMRQGLVFANSLCDHTFCEFSEAAAVSRGDSDTCVNDLHKKPG